MTSNTIPLISKNLYIKEFANKEVVFVLDYERPGWAFINMDGLRILNYCDGKRTIKDIARKIALNSPELNPEVVESGVSGFIKDMKKNYIVHESLSEYKTEMFNPFQGIALEVTHNCNLSCKHCYLSTTNEAPEDLTLNKIKEILDTTKAMGGISVSIGGGEPLSRWDIVEIIKYAHHIGLLITLGTNGTLINREWAKILADLPIKIQLSLDGATENIHDSIRGAGSFKKTMSGLNYLIEEGKGDDIVIAYTVMKPNLHELPLIIDLAKRKGIRFMQFPPITPAGNARKNWKELKLSKEEKLWFWNHVTHRARELKGVMNLLADCFSIDINNVGTPQRCTIGSTLRIDPGGNVYPCQCFHFGETFKLGNVIKGDLKDMILGEKLKKIMKLCFDRPKKTKECNKCKWMNLCGGGCMGTAFEEKMTIYEPNSCDERMKWIENMFEAKLEALLIHHESFDY